LHHKGAVGGEIPLSRCLGHFESAHMGQSDLTRSAQYTIETQFRSHSPSITLTQFPLSSSPGRSAWVFSPDAHL
jgi:hypothetical protein